MRTLILGGKKARQLGLVATVDDEDFERAAALPWHPNKSIANSKGDLSTWYVQGRNGLLLHRFLLGVTDRKIHADHRDGNGLNNQRSNLRLSTVSQNHANRPKARQNTTGFKGVYARDTGKWIAMISYMNRLRHLGTFNSPEEAAKAYDRVAMELWGKFARVNFPEN